MFDCKYLSDCRSKGHKFDPGPVPYFSWDWSRNNFCSHSPPSRWFKKGCCQLQAKVCAQSTGWLLSQACPGKKCGKVNWPSPHDQSCWLGHKEPNETKQNSMITPYGTFLIYYVFENIMENGSNAPFSIIFSKLFKTLLNYFLNFFNVV